MQCEPFYYGGCLGNSNRFEDLASCKEYCSPQKCQHHPRVTVWIFPFFARGFLNMCFFVCLLTALPVLCLDPLDKGKCSASFPRYYYNAASKKCEEFTYSGCGGSSNNFVSRQSCRDVCVRGVWGGNKGRNRSTVFITRLASKNENSLGSVVAMESRASVLEL